MAEPSTREQIAELMAGMQADQSAALGELHAALTGSTGNDVRAAIEAARERTIPGSPYDRMLGTFLNAFTATVGLAQKGSQAES